MHETNISAYSQTESTFIKLAITHSTSHTQMLATHNNNEAKTQLASSKTHLTIEQ